MKKLLAIAFIGGLMITGCAKKETSEESNTMMSEPETTMTDSSSNAAMDSTPVVAPTTIDSTRAK